MDTISGPELCLCLFRKAEIIFENILSLLSYWQPLSSPTKCQGLTLEKCQDKKGCAAVTAWVLVLHQFQFNIYDCCCLSPIEDLMAKYCQPKLRTRLKLFSKESDNPNLLNAHSCMSKILLMLSSVPFILILCKKRKAKSPQKD